MMKINVRPMTSIISTVLMSLLIMTKWQEVLMSLNLSYKAVILDLDGVVTDTRKLHLLSWQMSLNELLEELKLPAFIEKDYDLYIDGKTRDEGILSFLQSRKVELPCRGILQ